jgi:hypothetical protein
MEGGFIFFEAPPLPDIQNPHAISTINRARLASLQQDRLFLSADQAFDQPHSIPLTQIPLERATHLFTANQLETLRTEMENHLDWLNGIAPADGRIRIRRPHGLDALKECLWLSVAFGYPNLSFAELLRIAKRLAISNEVLFSGLAPAWGNEDFFKQLIIWHKQKNSLQTMMRSGDYRVFWQAARYGHVELLKIIADTVPDALIEMARACDDAASREAIRWNHLEALKYIVEIIEARMPQEPLRNYIEKNFIGNPEKYGGYFSFYSIVKGKNLDTMLHVMKEASDFYIKNYHSITGHPPYFTYGSLITLPDCFPALFDYAAQHPDHRVAFRHFINDYIEALKQRQERSGIGDRDAHILHSILQYLMQIDTSISSEEVWCQNHMHFILSLSKLQKMVKQNANQAVEGNSLLRLAIRFDNRTAEEILLAIPDVQRVANEHDLYKREEIRGSGIISKWTKIDFTPVAQIKPSNNTLETASADKPSITLLDDQSPAINPSRPPFTFRLPPYHGKSDEKARLWKELVMIMQIYQDTLRQVLINQHDHANYQNVSMLQQTTQALDELDKQLMQGRMDAVVGTVPHLLTCRIEDFTAIINSINSNASEHAPLKILKELAKKMVQPDVSLAPDYQNMQWSDARKEFTEIVTAYLKHLERSVSRHQDTHSLLSKKQAILKDLAHHLTIGNSDQEAVLRGLAFFDIMINRNDMSMLLSERRCGQYAVSRGFSLFVKRIDHFLKNTLHLSARYRPFTRVEFERVTEKISLFRQAHHLAPEPNKQRRHGISRA